MVRMLLKRDEARPPTSPERQRLRKAAMAVALIVSFTAAAAALFAAAWLLWTGGR